jgi:hypothetical protein
MEKRPDLPKIIKKRLNLRKIIEKRPDNQKS